MGFKYIRLGRGGWVLAQEGGEGPPEQIMKTTVRTGKVSLPKQTCWLDLTHFLNNYPNTAQGEPRRILTDTTKLLGEIMDI